MSEIIESRPAQNPQTSTAPDAPSWPSGVRLTDTESPASAFAVAGGCLPAWWLELLELVEEWERRAGSARNDEEWHKRRDSMLQREAHTRWAVYHSCAEELRRKLGSTNFRQPEDNQYL